MESTDVESLKADIRRLDDKLGVLLMEVPSKYATKDELNALSLLVRTNAERVTELRSSDRQWINDGFSKAYQQMVDISNRMNLTIEESTRRTETKFDEAFKTHKGTKLTIVVSAGGWVLTTLIVILQHYWK